MGSILTSEANDLTLVDIVSLVDVLYIGDTENTVLFGEALIIHAETLESDFRFVIK